MEISEPTEEAVCLFEDCQGKAFDQMVWPAEGHTWYAISVDDCGLVMLDEYPKDCKKDSEGLTIVENVTFPFRDRVSYRLILSALFAAEVFVE